MTTLYHKSLEGDIPFTEEEEAEYYAREAAFIPDYSFSVQVLLDQNANRLQYDNIMSAISYVGDPNSQFNNEAITFRTWRSQVWFFHNQLLDNIKAGTAEKISPEEFIALLPTCPI